MSSEFGIEMHPVIALRPRLAEPLSWAGHIPFAYLLMDLARPRLFVELGTHSGNSYLAFCQAVQHLGIDTRCVAIDSWEGDAHADVYGEQVLRTLRAYHDPRYGAFSELRRAYFDAAVESFPDQSIDLLHIDGLHTYEAVRNDFETWCPKLSERAIVLFHDIAVQGRDFGVDAYFTELQARYPGLRFEHSNGLGVLFVGREPPQAVTRFVDAFNARPDAFRSYFAALGEAVIDGGDRRVGDGGISSQLYYRGRDSGYSEDRRLDHAHDVVDGLAVLEFPLPDGAEVDCIRIDPAEAPGCFGVVAIELLDVDGLRIDEHVDLTRTVVAVNGFRLSPKEPAWLRWMEFGPDPYAEFDLSSLACIRQRIVRGVRVTLHFEVTALSTIDRKLAQVFHEGVADTAVEPDALRKLATALSAEALSTRQTVLEESASTRVSIDGAAQHARNLQAVIEDSRRESVARDQTMRAELRELLEALRLRDAQTTQALDALAREQSAMHAGMKRRSPVWWIRRLFGAHE